MWWPAFLTIRRRQKADERRRAFEQQLDAGLAVRKAARPALTERARKGAATKAHAAFERDALRNSRVTF